MVAAKAYVAAEGFAIEFIEEESEWRQCRACGKAWVYLDEDDVGCRGCGSEDTEMVEEVGLIARNREV